MILVSQSLNTVKKNDKTWASVEIKQGDKFCKGDWTANVVFDQDVIATDTISVS